MDKRDVERLFREVGPRVWRSVYGYVGARRELTDDVVSEAFARALHHHGRIRDGAAWLYRTAFRIATDELRREPRSRKPVDNPTSNLAHLDARRDLVEAMRRLPKNQRAALVLYYVDDRPLEEVARMMGIAQATARVHLFRARRRMRVLMESHDD